MTASIEVFTEAFNQTVVSMGVGRPENGQVERCDGEPIRADTSSHLTVRNDEELVLVMTVTKPLAVECVRRIAGMEVGFEDDLVADTVGELLNVVAGSAQREAKYDFTIPVIARGVNHLVNVHTGGRVERVVSKLAGGEVSLYRISPS